MQRVGIAARPDLEPRLAQHAAERDDLPDERLSPAACAPPRRAPRAPSSRTVSRSSWYLSTEPSVCSTISASSSLPAERGERVRPVDRLRDARRLRQVEAAEAADEPRRLRRQPLGIPGTRSTTISISRSSAGCPIQWKRQRRLSASCSSRVRFEVRITLGRRARRDRADLRDRDLEVGEHLEQERLELLVGAVDLVDQQHDGLGALDRLEQRPADQELRPEQLLPRRPSPPAPRGCAGAGASSSTRRRRARRRGPRSTGAGSAAPGSARASAFAASVFPTPASPSSSSGFSSRKREVERGREPAVGQVVRLAQRALELVDRLESHFRTLVRH